MPTDHGNDSEARTIRRYVHPDGKLETRGVESRRIQGESGVSNPVLCYLASRYTLGNALGSARRTIMTTTERPAARTDDVSTGRDASRTISENDPSNEARTLDEAALITLVRRAPALAALREQPLDRRDIEERLGVSKPTVHRLTRTLDEMELVERSNGIFVLTGLGETVADVIGEFTRSVETAYRLAPLLETSRCHYPAVDVAGFADATVTTAEPGDPYGPMRRYLSFIEKSNTLRWFDTTTLPPEYVETVHRQIHDGMNAELIYPPAVISHLYSAHPERVAALVENDRLVLRVHPSLPYGLAIFDERVAVASYCETTGALRTVIDTGSPAGREWAEDVYEEYCAEATELPAQSALIQHPSVKAFADADG